MKTTKTYTVVGALLGGAMMTAMAADSGSLFSNIRGSLGVAVGQTWLDGDAVTPAEENDFTSGLVEFRLAADVGSDYYGQLDLLGEMTDIGNHDDSHDSGLAAAIHILKKDGNGGGLGVFAGVLQTDQDNDRSDSSKRIFGGLEGLFSRNDIDFHWQLGGLIGDGGDDDAGDDSISSAIFGRLVASKALDCGWTVSGEVSVAVGEMDTTPDDINIIGWGLSARRQITPCWVTEIIYQGNHYDQNIENDTISEHYVGVSMTYHFGAGSDPEASGPNLDLPPLLRWVGISGGQLE